MKRALAICCTLSLGMAVAAGVASTAATWTAHQVASGALTAASSACTATGLYSGTAAARFVVGSVGGTALDPVVALSGLSAANDGRSASPTPSTAAAAGTEAWRAPVVASALNGTLTAAASGVTLAGGTGAWTQYAEAHSTGASLGASGAVTSGGAIDDAAIGAGTAPGLGSIDLGAVLTGAGHASALPALSGLGVKIGAVASITSINACTTAWGGTGTHRDYRVAALRLAFRDGSVDTLRSGVQSASTAVTAASAALAGTPSSTTSASEASLQTTAASTLGSVLLAAAPAGLVHPTVASSATVAIDAGSGISAAVSSALGEVLTDPSGLVTVDFGSGAITVDASVLAALNGRPANTSVLSTSAMTSVQSALTSVLTTYRQDVSRAWDALKSGETVTITMSSTLSASIAGVTTPLASVTANASGTAASFANGTETRSGPTVSVLGAGLINAAALQSALTAAAPASLFAPIDTAVGSTISGVLDSPIGTGRSSTATALSTASSALAGDLAPLPNVLRITLNVQPDASPRPSPWYAGSSTGVTSVSALRIELATGSVDDLDLRFANSAAGPDLPVG